MVSYVAKDGDALDWICWRHYGTTAVLEQVMKANPGLTDERLKGGTLVLLPYIEAMKKTTAEVRLWS